MVVHSYAIAWNEEKIIPYYLKYYSDFCDKIVIYDNESTDRTVEIIKSFPNTEVRSWGSNGQINDQMYLTIKNQCYKEARGIADWVIVGDADEFLFHPDLVNKLEEYKNSGVTMPRVTGYDMVPNCELDPEANLPYVYRQGARATNFDKRMIFNPKMDISYSMGCHTLNFRPNDMIESADSLYMFHYKKLNLKYYQERHTLLGERLSDFNRRGGLGIHYQWSLEQMRSEYNEVLRNSIQVL